MKKMSPFAQNFEQLPRSLAVFPLSNAIVLPGSTLPLNIFEPRYLALLKDIMRGDQLIGMVQPKNTETVPTLFNVGCAARVTSYQETNDGRLEIILTGLCRFAIKSEIPSIRGYRVIEPDWQAYQHDCVEEMDIKQENKLLLNGVLRQYFTNKNLDVDWNSFAKVSAETLLNNLISQLALSSEDKQMLIETPELDARVKSFCALLEMNMHSNGSSH